MLMQRRNLHQYIGKEVYIFIIRTVGQDIKLTAVTPWPDLDSPVVFNQRPQSSPARQDISLSHALSHTMQIKFLFEV
jgi:hypothetical protein